MLNVASAIIVGKINVKEAHQSKSGHYTHIHAHTQGSPYRQNLISFKICCYERQYLAIDKTYPHLLQAHK